MAAINRIIMLLVMCSLVALMLLMFMSHRGLGDMGPAQVNARYLVLVASQSPAAHYAAQILGNPPPPWARRLAVVWDHANPIFWWWLPLVLTALILLISRFSRRRLRR